MKKFVNTEYRLSTKKLQSAEELRLCFLSDLHGNSYGPGNEKLLRAVKDSRPDAILIAGDLLTWSDPSSLPVAAETARGLAGIAPVYYSLGNHEKRLDTPEDRDGERTRQMSREYQKYKHIVRTAGVHLLDNEMAELSAGGTRLFIYGLTIPQECYKKPFPKRLPQRFLEKNLPKRKEDGFSILLAHNPVFGDRYFDWGADLTLSGHFHGGVLRLTRHVGVISPQFRLFPPYCCGDFYKDGKAMIVSTGIGEHEMPVRINDPRELVSIRLSRG